MQFDEDSSFRAIWHTKNILLNRCLALIVIRISSFVGTNSVLSGMVFVILRTTQTDIAFSIVFSVWLVIFVVVPKCDPAPRIRSCVGCGIGDSFLRPAYFCCLFRLVG